MANNLMKITGMFTPDPDKPKTKTVLSGKNSQEITIPAGSRIMMFKNDPNPEKPKAPPYSLVFSAPEGQQPQPSQAAPPQTADDLPF